MKFFCEYCGYNIDANKDSKCPNCGAMYNKNRTYVKLMEDNIINKKKEENENKTMWIILLLIFVGAPFIVIIGMIVISLIITGA